MRITFYYLLFTTALSLIGCAKNTTESEPELPRTVKLKLSNGRFATRVIDADNLAVEQTVVDITVYFTEPGADEIVESYVHAGFTSVDDYKIVTIPLDPADLGTKDIYVVTNYDDEPPLEAITTVTDLKALTTPVADKNNNLDPAAGLCTYGFTEGFDFTTGETAVVNAIRTCAKLRVTLTFPDDSDLSTDNSYVVGHAAGYTYVANDVGDPTLTAADYFNFASAIPLTRDASGNYTHISYVYEAPEPPRIYLYTHLNGSMDEQEFTTALPIPVRNHLYDLQLYVYEEDDETTNTRTADRKKSYRFSSTLTVWDAEGNPVH